MHPGPADSAGCCQPVSPASASQFPKPQNPSLKTQASKPKPHDADAFFGEKDFQQFRIVSDMTSTLKYNINIIPCKTVRESNGLAMSSRNEYLTNNQRNRAGIILPLDGQEEGENTLMLVMPVMLNS